MTNLHIGVPGDGAVREGTAPAAAEAAGMRLGVASL